MLYPFQENQYTLDFLGAIDGAKQRGREAEEAPEKQDKDGLSESESAVGMEAPAAKKMRAPLAP